MDGGNSPSSFFSAFYKYADFYNYHGKVKINCSLNFQKLIDIRSAQIFN